MPPHIRQCSGRIRLAKVQQQFFFTLKHERAHQRDWSIFFTASTSDESRWFEIVPVLEGVLRHRVNAGELTSATITGALRQLEREGRRADAVEEVDNLLLVLLSSGGVRAELIVVGVS